MSDEYRDPLLGSYVPSFPEKAGSKAESMLQSAHLGVPSSPSFFPRSDQTRLQ